MGNPRNKLVLEIERVIADLQAIADGLQDGKPAVLPPQFAVDKAAKRICLDCGRQIGVEERVRRGQCDACYQATRIRLKNRKVTEDVLIAKGAYLPLDPGPNRGRKSLVSQIVAEGLDAETEIRIKHARYRAKRGKEKN